jgi:hypothetical protein
VTCGEGAKLLLTSNLPPPVMRPWKTQMILGLSGDGPGAGHSWADAGAIDGTTPSTAASTSSPATRATE